MNNKYVNRVNLIKLIRHKMIGIRIDNAYFILEYNITKNYIYSISLYYSEISNDITFEYIGTFNKIHTKKMFEKYMNRIRHKSNDIYIPIDVFVDEVCKYDKNIFNRIKKYVSVF